VGELWPNSVTHHRVNAGNSRSLKAIDPAWMAFAAPLFYSRAKPRKTLLGLSITAQTATLLPTALAIQKRTAAASARHRFCQLNGVAVVAGILF
jgi:hypothetical protein